MIRVVLTVLVAVALLGAAMPALEDARAGTTAERLGTEGDRIERVAAAIAAGSVAVPERELAARRSIVVRAPGGFAAARIDRLALIDGERVRNVTDGRRMDTDVADGTVTDGAVALVYRTRGDSPRALTVSPPTDAVDIAVVDGPIELRTSGESRLELGFVDRGGPTVEIVRVG